jgi:pimeloyl-ACP methyl ester carboxylesterase
MPAVLKHARTPRLEVAYEEQGDSTGRPAVLVHGFPDDVRTWDAVTHDLVRAGYRTLAPYVRGYGRTRFLHDASPRSGQVAALAQDVVEFADALRLDRFVLVGHDWGARAGYAVAAAWPERLHALVVLAVGYDPPVSLRAPAVAQAHAFWYQWYFHVNQGRAALERERRELCRRLWASWSPGWRFDDAAFGATAVSFDNPDFVDVVIHYYRHRWGNAPGDPRYDALHARLQGLPAITVPTALLCGADDGVSLPEASQGREPHFAAPYARRVLRGVGHFIQREQPRAVVDAVMALCPAR